MMPHGGQPQAVAELAGYSPDEVLDFSASINPDGPPATVVAALRAALLDAASLTRYPDLQSAELKRALAMYAGCAPENVAVANGFVPLLEAALHTLPLRSCVVPVPAFGEYRRSLQQHGLTIQPLTLDADNDFRYECDALLGSGADAVLLANPQNPTGVLTPGSVLRKLTERVALQGKFVLLDEAFIDYAPGESLAAEAGKFPNLIVFRSVTKCFGIPGLRVAYAVAEADLLQRVQAVLAPWPCTTLAASGVVAAVRDADFIAQFQDRNAARRRVLQAGFERLGFTVYPAAANYLLVRVPAATGTAPDATTLWRNLAMRGILLRACDSFEGLPPGHLRVAVRSARDNARLLEEVAQELR